MAQGKKVRHHYMFITKYFYYDENSGMFKNDLGQIKNVNSLASYDWQIYQEPKTRPMTWNEILGFLANTKGIVVRFDGPWALPSTYSFPFDGRFYEYAYIDEKGNIGEPKKFEVTE